MIARRRFNGYVIAVASLLNVGCYTAGPMMAEPKPAERVVFTLNDRGRAALSEVLGSGPVSVEGLVESADPAAYMVRVSRVSYIGTGFMTWTGERVRIGRDDVSMTQQRKLSRGRTLLAVGAAVVAIGAFIVTRSLVGWGQDAPEVPGEPAGQ